MSVLWHRCVEPMEGFCIPTATDVGAWFLKGSLVPIMRGAPHILLLGRDFILSSTVLGMLQCLVPKKDMCSERQCALEHWGIVSLD